MQIARETADLLRAAGLPCKTIAGAGTGTYENELGSGVYTELQCGSYAFMDADYGRNETATPFANALFILTSDSIHLRMCRRRLRVPCDVASPFSAAVFAHYTE